MGKKKESDSSDCGSMGLWALWHDTSLGPSHALVRYCLGSQLCFKRIDLPREPSYEKWVSLYKPLELEPLWMPEGLGNAWEDKTATSLF